MKNFTQNFITNTHIGVNDLFSLINKKYDNNTGIKYDILEEKDFSDFNIEQCICSLEFSNTLIGQQIEYLEEFNEKNISESMDFIEEYRKNS